MLSARLLHAVSRPRAPFVCLLCSAHAGPRAPTRPQARLLSASAPRRTTTPPDTQPDAAETNDADAGKQGEPDLTRRQRRRRNTTARKDELLALSAAGRKEKAALAKSQKDEEKAARKAKREEKKAAEAARHDVEHPAAKKATDKATAKKPDGPPAKLRIRKVADKLKPKVEKVVVVRRCVSKPAGTEVGIATDGEDATLRAATGYGTIKEAMLAVSQKGNPGRKVLPKNTKDDDSEKPAKKIRGLAAQYPNLQIDVLSPDDLDFRPIDHKIPPVPKLAHGLDRVLFNPGIYRLQDPRSRVYNFDPYLEKIMPAAEFDFDALSEYKTSSKDEDLIAITRKEGTKFTGSTSSMSGVLQHFHFLLSDFRPLNHEMMSRNFPPTTGKFSKITMCPSPILLRKKNGIYAIDADKTYDTPNIMSWMGHSMEKLLTNSPEEFEKYRRSTPDVAPNEDDSGKCFHYSRLGNVLMRSQLDAHDDRLPGTGIFDLKTRAVVSIRMDHSEYATGSGYQIRYDQGEWESFEREFYDMTRATLLKYSLQVRMGRMDGIFVAFHNIERIFGFQYMSLADMDLVLHGQSDTCLGDQEFKLSVRLLDELLQRATDKFPDSSIRVHFETQKADPAFMSVFAEPITEEQADEIQNHKSDMFKEFERDIIGLNKDDPETQAEWKDIQARVDEELVDDEVEGDVETATEDQLPVEESDAASAGEAVSVEEEVVAIEEVAADEEAAASEDVVGEQKEEVTDEAVVAIPEGPLMGWTLAIRNVVNGAYVATPEKLESTDNWSLEYHINEIKEDQKWGLYKKVLARRNNLLGMDRAEQTKSLRIYREMIKKYSTRGRAWRQKQDKIDAAKGQKVFRPLGPGAADVLRRELGIAEETSG